MQKHTAIKLKQASFLCQLIILSQIYLFIYLMPEYQLELAQFLQFLQFLFNVLDFSCFGWMLFPFTSSALSQDALDSIINQVAGWQQTQVLSSSSWLPSLHLAVLSSFVPCQVFSFSSFFSIKYILYLFDA